MPQNGQLARLMAWGTVERARASLSSCSTESAREEVGDGLVGRWQVGIRMLARELKPVRASTRLAFRQEDGRVSGRGNTKARPVRESMPRPGAHPPILVLAEARSSREPIGGRRRVIR